MRKWKSKQIYIENILQVRIAMGSDKYLGLSSMIERSKKDLFKSIMKRVLQEHLSHPFPDKGCVRENDEFFLMIRWKSLVS